MDVKQIVPSASFLGTKMVFYPDPFEPTPTTVDGRVWQSYASESGVTWATIIAAPGSGASRSDDYFRCVRFLSDALPGPDYGADKWQRVSRAILTFDTSSLTSGATITSATLSLYGKGKDDNNSNTPNVNIYSAVPANNDNLEAGDFNSLGATAYCDTPIAYVDWSSSGYNDFILNATGLAAISKTGITKIGVRNVNYDVDGVMPSLHSTSTTAAHVDAWSVEKGTIYRPKLTITYYG